MKNSWAGCYTRFQTYDGHFTNNMVESHNQKIKSAVKRFSSVSSLVTELIKITARKNFANQQKISTMLLKMQSIPLGVAATDKNAIVAIHQTAIKAAAQK